MDDDGEPVTSVTLWIDVIIQQYGVAYDYKDSEGTERTNEEPFAEFWAIRNNQYQYSVMQAFWQT